MYFYWALCNWLSLLIVVGSTERSCGYTGIGSQFLSWSPSAVSWKTPNQGDQIFISESSSTTWQIKESLLQFSLSHDEADGVVQIIKEAGANYHTPEVGKDALVALSHKDRARLTCLVAKFILAGRGHVSEEGLVNYTLKTRNNW